MRFERVHNMIPAVLIAAGLLISVHGCKARTGDVRSRADTRALTTSMKASAESSNMNIHYLEIVTNDVDSLCAAYERIHALSFGPEDPDLGQARVAVRPDGSLVGIRKPLAEHEQPTTRTYLTVADIQKAVKEAEEVGAVIAYPPTRQGERGTFAIFIHGGVEHGLWQQ